jgi:large subunit ribosomal protein L9
MEVILLQPVHGLGKMGQTVKVQPGYARNFLLPHSKALPASPANLKKYESMREQLEKQLTDEKAKAEVQAKKLEGKVITLKRQASDQGQLYGSVKARDISIELKAIGFNVPQAQVMIGNAIKSLGEHQVQIALYADVIVPLKVQVEKAAN